MGIGGKLFHFEVGPEIFGTAIEEGLRMKRLTEREWRWIWEFTGTGSNASQAARVVYGGTPISVRVKGHKKKVKLKPFLERTDRIWDQFMEKEVSQVEREMDAYLKRLRRKS